MNKTFSIRVFKFTVVELLLVFTVLAILVTLLQPAFKRVRENAYAVECVQNLKKIAFATSNYLQDNSNVFIRETYNFDGRRYYNNNEFVVERFGNYQVTYDSIYLEDKEAFTCPKSYKKSAWGRDYSEAEVFSYDYAMNSHLYSKTLDSLKNPSQIMTQTDANYEFIHRNVGHRVDVRHGSELVHLWADGHADKRNYLDFLQ